MASDKSKFRQRFSIAHEIGHTLFYRGEQHQIGALSKREVQTEELICDRFAAALLMPAEAVRTVFRGVKATAPWSIFKAMESAALRMQVSLPALVVRLSQVEAVSPIPLIVLCFRYFANEQTGQFPRLRVDFSASTGTFRGMYTWHNKSAINLNLTSASELFDRWRLPYGQRGAPTGGAYVTAESGLAKLSEATAIWRDEAVSFDVKRKGKWHKEHVPMKGCSCLYAARGWGEELAYVLTILK